VREDLEMMIGEDLKNRLIESKEEYRSLKIMLSEQSSPQKQNFLSWLGLACNRCLSAKSKKSPCNQGSPSSPKKDPG